MTLEVLEARLGFPAMRIIPRQRFPRKYAIVFQDDLVSSGGLLFEEAWDVRQGARGTPESNLTQFVEVRCEKRLVSTGNLQVRRTSEIPEDGANNGHLRYPRASTKKKVYIPTPGAVSGARTVSDRKNERWSLATTS